jgi:hypothetical protein
MVQFVHHVIQIFTSIFPHIYLSILFSKYNVHNLRSMYLIVKLVLMALAVHLVRMDFLLKLYHHQVFSFLIQAIVICHNCSLLINCTGCSNTLAIYLTCNNNLFIDFSTGILFLINRKQELCSM